MNGTDFKDLWQNQHTESIPDLTLITGKASSLTKRTRNKLFFGNALLLLTAVFIIYIINSFTPEMPTTKIGALLVIIAMAMMLIASGPFIAFLNKNQNVSSAAENLRYMIELKKKQGFIQTTIMNLYFILLSIGVFLYMLEFALRMTIVSAIAVYGITTLWIAFNWFYIRPRTIKKQQKKLNQIIENLTRLTTQFDEDATLL